jgi:hypothetical protein
MARWKNGRCTPLDMEMRFMNLKITQFARAIPLVIAAAGLTGLCGTAHCAAELPGTAGGTLEQRIRADLRLALLADRMRGSETSYPSSLKLKKQRAINAERAKHFDEARKYYHRVLTLLAQAKSQGTPLPPRLEERALSLSAWALSHDLGNPRHWTFRSTAREIRAAGEKYPSDATSALLLAQFYMWRGRLIPSGLGPVVDAGTGKIVRWAVVHPSKSQAELRRHCFLKSAYFAIRALRLSPDSPVGNKDLWNDLSALGLDPKNRDYYFARAYLSRKDVNPVFFNFETYLVRNFQWNLDHEMGTGLHALLAKVKHGQWKSRPPELPRLPPGSDSPDPSSIDILTTMGDAPASAHR